MIIAKKQNKSKRKKKTWEASRVLSKMTISWIGKGHTKHMYLVFSKLENIAVLLNCWNNSSTFMGNILQERREKETFVCCCFIFLPVSSNYNRSRENSVGTPDSNNNNNHYSFDLSRGFLKEDNKKNEKQVLKHLLFCLIFIAISVVTWVQQQCANFGFKMIVIIILQITDANVCRWIWMFPLPPSFFSFWGVRGGGIQRNS